MRVRKTGVLLLGAMALPTFATAQTRPAPPATTRTVVAATKLPTVTDVPLYFKVVSVILPPGEKSGVAAPNGILYQIAGSTEVSLGGEAQMLGAGEGLFIPGGKTAVLTAGSGGPSTFLQFFLAPAGDLDRPPETAPAAVRELYRTAGAFGGTAEESSGDTGSGGRTWRCSPRAIERTTAFPRRSPQRSRGGRTVLPEGTRWQGREQCSPFRAL